MHHRGGLDLDTLSDMCAAAAERVAARLDSTRPEDLPPGLTVASLGLVGEILPLLVQGYFLELVGEPGALGRFAAALRRFGGDRAREGGDIAGFVQVTSSGRTSVLEQILDELGDSVDADTKLDLFRGMIHASDDLVSEYIVGYTEEIIALRGEADPMSCAVAGSLQTGLAMSDLGGRILYANPTFGRLLDVHAEMVLGRCWNEIVGDTGFYELFETALQRGEAWGQIESRLGDEERILRLGMRVVEDRVHVMLLDTSDQAQAERERREFLRGLMHDIRSPLTLMSGWANTLLRADGELDSDTRRRALETILRAAKQVGNLTENLLELDLVEGGHELDTRPFDVGTRVHDIVTHSSIEGVRIAASRGVVALGDPEAFDRVVTNLLENAAAHGTPPIRVALTPDGAGLRITIEDAGRVDKDRVEEAFERRVPSSNGFGLGLHATRQLVEAMGGSIRLASAEPTTFCVCLPHGT